MGLADGMAWENEFGSSYELDKKLEELNVRYKESCRNELKVEMNKLFNDFIDNDSVNKEYKQRIINIIGTLLKLK